MRWALFGEILTMSWDTLRGNKMRSALTVLGVVIGITSIVGITALIRGFDQSFKDAIKTLNPNTIFIAKFSGLSLFSGGNLNDRMRQLMLRPNMTPEDAVALERNAPSITAVEVILGQGTPGEQVSYRNQKTPPVQVWGTGERYLELTGGSLETGRFFSYLDVERRHTVILLGYTPYRALFPNEDPIGKTVRVGLHQYEVIGVLAKRPNVSLGQDPDGYVILPQTTYQKQFGIKAFRVGRGEMRAVMLGAEPREGVSREQAMQEIEDVMRIRHGLKLDEPDDFDLITQDAALGLWERISQATFLALVALSSIALLVGGIGVMSVMTISVTERTREIGVRKALGARRIEILWQFLLEAVFLTSAGGVLGILLGSAIGLGVHALTGFPVSLPWWSFAIGIGFSAGIGVFFGMMPAIRASRLDPIEALRYE
jgi:putative ABC transport system permease protein